MKRQSLFLVVSAALLTLQGCDKSTDLDYGLFADWTLNAGTTKEYTAKGITVEPDGYYSCSKDTSIQVFFAAHPPALGKYRIVDQGKAPAHALAAGEVAVEFNVGLNDVYLSIDGTDSASVVVTDKGFRHLYVPLIKVVHFNNGMAYDTITASGNISFPDNK